MQPVAGGREDGLLRELSRVGGLRWLPGTPALAPRNVSVLVIIAVLAAKLPGPNWIVSPDWATSTALSSVAHGPLSRVHAVGAARGDVDGHGLRSGRERDQQCERGEQSQQGPAPAAVRHQRSQR